MHQLEVIRALEGRVSREIPLVPNINSHQVGYCIDEEGHLTDISLYGCNIRFLNRLVPLLQKLPFLTNLNLTGNQIANIAPLSVLNSLEGLYLAENLITDVNSLRNLTNLLDLDLYSNEISDITAISNLTELRGLDLYSNEIFDITPISPLTKLSHLYLSENHIRDITPLKNLLNLTQLYISGNEITDLYPLSFLKGLIGLYLSGNKIIDITPLINFFNLTKLYLSENNISDITPLQTLSNLSQLYLSKNDITDIAPLGGLNNLTELYLSNNNITDIAPLGGLNNLTELYLSNNNITNINSFSTLTNLTSLALSNNKIINIAPIQNLKKLHVLDLSNNPIEVLYPWIVNFNMDIQWTREIQIKRLCLFNNPLQIPPVEIVKQGKDSIKVWFEEEKVYVNEVKVLLVGHGEVGKTTLVKRLSNQKTNHKEPPTHYIRISMHTIEHKHKTIKLNFWDFGGQEVMHATHQFFLSARSIYLLVLDGRQDEDAEYWLKHIESFGGKSPALVVMNKVDTNPSYDLNRQFLTEKYPFIQGFYRTACLDNVQGIDKLEEGLRTALDQLEILTMPWPKNWLSVKNSLENMAQNFISQWDYEKLCEENGIRDNVARETLAGYLNDLGIVVHFKDFKLSDLHILQPRWASRAAYKIINSTKVAEQAGLLKIDWLAEIMQKEDDNDFVFQQSTFSYILCLMQKFELCFALKEDQQYLIPELMNIQQPPLPDHSGPVLRFFLQFTDLLPRSIMPRFIVRMHEDIENDLRWRTGVVLSVPIFGSTAIVIADVKERRINITVSGRRRREHFALIRKTFHSLKDDFRKLTITEWIPLLDSPNYAIEYDELIGYEESDREEYFVGKLKKTYKVKDLLDGIELENVRKDEYEWDAFLCHASADKEVVRQIAKDFKLRGIRYWLDDEQIRPGENIMDKIVEGLQKSRHIIPCLSNNQLKSNWSKKEYQVILMRIINGHSKQLVIPLILDDTEDEDIPTFLSDIRCERYCMANQYEGLLDFLARRQR
ncbi:MAG: leucine-rich repeat domain-containing protein [Tolypothrix sp. T3-bin4]|nr:leucine-rich repeat domain-containing protein [Tolypothrix sp. T3-bin4]